MLLWWGFCDGDTNLFFSYVNHSTFNQKVFLNIDGFKSKFNQVGEYYNAFSAKNCHENVGLKNMDGTIKIFKF